ALLRALTRATLWIDRGVVRRREKGFDSFEAWRDKTWEEEDISRHKLNRKIKAEGRWAVEGISARRKRNQGRLRALADLRTARGAMIRRQGTAGMVLETGARAGKRVIDARDISHGFDGTDILRGFSIRVARGDRVAFVGPNGVGKTTLINILTGQLAPDAGTVRLGTNLDIAVFDQNRSGLAGDLSLWENLVGDASMRVSGKADQIMVRGRPRHVVGYLKDFLFAEVQARAPVRSLSGGEKSRLLLARLMARASNLLVLDEPTNDLDVETLDLLQELLADYDGTVLLVSHDRDFIDRVATITVAMEGDGQAVIYAGGWSDYQAQRGAKVGVESPKRNTENAVKSIDSKQKKTTAILSSIERHRLSELPTVIEQLEAEISKLTEYLSDPERFGREPARFRKASAALADRQTALAAAEGEWVVLEDKSSS
ncbi:MAG: ATP-binding cassette domain-containing protein, partial [Paracoccaceae bacterium]